MRKSFSMHRKLVGLCMIMALALHLTGCTSERSGLSSSASNASGNAEKPDFFAQHHDMEQNAAGYSIRRVTIGETKFFFPDCEDKDFAQIPLPETHIATSAGIFFADRGHLLYLLTKDDLYYVCDISSVSTKMQIMDIPSADPNVVFFRAEGENPAEVNYIYRYYLPSQNGRAQKLLDLNSEAFRSILTAYQGVVTHWQAINNRELIFVIEPMADVPEDSDAYRTFLEQERERLKDNEKARQLLDAMLHGDGEVVYRPMIVYDTETRKMKTLYTQGEQKMYIESVSNILWNPVQE